jgi:ABC-2 type transport system ATP-binding protein
MPALSIKGLKKKFGAFEALKGIDLAIPQGEFFGLLGPNGAGKSTLINCVSGLTRPSAGDIEVFGRHTVADFLQARQHIGLSPQEVNLERFMSIEKILFFQGGYYGLARAAARQRAEELLKQFRLWERRGDPYMRLSGGMQKRVMIARALMAYPKLLMLDEPTAGLDVESRHELWAYLQRLNQNEGITILLTTHYIEEAELLCGRVGIIHQGSIIVLGAPHELLQTHAKTRLEDVFIKLTGMAMAQIERSSDPKISAVAVE